MANSKPGLYIDIEKFEKIPVRPIDQTAIKHAFED